MNNPINNTAEPASRKEKLAWCFYDFANSGYTTVVLTAIFNAYFVGTVAAGNEFDQGTATFLWTIAMAIANGIVLLSAPVLGAIADHSAAKKKFLMVSTIGCIVFTACLSLVGPGDVVLAMILVILATLMFASGENFIAAFLPEISPPENMGRLSGYGWAIGYLGGLLTLGLCIAYVLWAQKQGKPAAEYVPPTNLIVAVIFALAALPTFIWLKERAVKKQNLTLTGYIRCGYQRLHHTLSHAKQHQDLFRFLLTLIAFQSGVATVIVLAAVYAQEVMGFEANDTLMLVLIVNVTAAIGALIFGHLQDKIGSKLCLAITIFIWSIAILIAYLGNSTTLFWIAANLIGIAMGASQSASRAMVGQFSPPQRSGEFFGLWGLAARLAMIIGPLSYGAITYLSAGNQRMAILSTLAFFVVGLILLLTVNEKRGKQAAIEDRWG